MKETTHFLIGTSPLKPHYSLTAIGSKTGAAETHREAVGIWFFLPVQKLPTSQRFLLEPQAAQHRADTPSTGIFQGATTQKQLIFGLHGCNSQQQ